MLTVPVGTALQGQVADCPQYGHILRRVCIFVVDLREVSQGTFVPLL
jgi:hypothetical protein